VVADPAEGQRNEREEYVCPTARADVFEVRFADAGGEHGDGYRVQQIDEVDIDAGS
jgi:hypothetical protein